jgi:hypothetical protein
VGNNIYNSYSTYLKLELCDFVLNWQELCDNEVHLLRYMTPLLLYFIFMPIIRYLSNTNNY